MSAVAPFGLRCPECDAVLRPDRTKINVEVDICPSEHGLLLDREDVESLVGGETATRIHDLVLHGDPTALSCPNCSALLRSFVVNTVPARGCAKCGILWFAVPDLRAHVLEVRKRAYGPQSMAARFEVVRDATAFMPGEVVAGLLTDYQLETEI